MNIKITSVCELYDGMSVTFQAPCDCTAVEGLKVCYGDTSQIFTFKDAHGNNLAGLGNLFTSGAYVKAVLDINNGFAYLQNADTNAYLQAELDSKAPRYAPVKTVAESATLALEDVGNFLHVTAGATITVPAGVLPVGAELEIFRGASGEVKISPASGVSFVIPGNTSPTTTAASVSEQYASVVLKQIAADVWSIQGVVG